MVSSKKPAGSRTFIPSPPNYHRYRLRSCRRGQGSSTLEQDQAPLQGPKGRRHRSLGPTEGRPRSVSFIRFVLSCIWSGRGSGATLLVRERGVDEGSGMDVEKFLGTGSAYFSFYAVCGFHPEAKSLRRLLAMQTSFHSWPTFWSPRRLKRRNPRCSLMCPKTGSTMALRIL